MEDYDRANRLWLEDAGPGDEPFDRDLFSRVQSTRRAVLPRLLEYNDKDTALRDTLADFALSAASYAGTGMHLEVAGQRNILFFKDHGDKWNYMLVDAQYSACAPAVMLAADILPMIAQGRQPSQKQASILLNALNFVRTVNGVLHYLGLQERRIRLTGGAPTQSVPWEIVYRSLRARSKPRPPNVVPFQLSPSWRQGFVDLIPEDFQKHNVPV